jgi:hypothetical protein
VLGGLGYLVAEIVAGQLAAGLFAFGFMLLVAAGFVLAARRSETVRGLMDQRDERIAGINLRATAAAGSLLIVAVIVGAMVELARGRSGAPYTWLAAVGYVAAVAVERVRR